MESRLGQDFGGVRVHTDESAAGSARALRAAAFTVGADIAFAKGRYAPASTAGRALLAHELTHVLQQANGPRFLARQRVEQYETRGIEIDPARLDTLAELGYWEQKLRSVLRLGTDPATEARLQSNLEERDAVLSIAFQMRPHAAITRAVTNIVTIPRRAAVHASQDLAYQITFRPRIPPDKLDIVEILFIAEGAGARSIAPQPPSTSFRPRPIAYKTSSFPMNDAPKYWQTHREAQRRVFSWIETSAPRPGFDQVITTAVTDGRSTRSALFEVKGKKDTSSGRVSDLHITYLGDVAPSFKTVSAGYASHDFGDQALEDVQTPSDPGTHDKLGAINGLSVLPQTEQPSVKYAISQYFKGGIRNAEVDAIVPIVEGPLFTEAMTAKGLSPTARDTAAEFARIGVRLMRPGRVLYTFRFKPNTRDPHTSDVDIQRIGAEGKEVSLTPQGDLGRVNGFSIHTQGRDQHDVQPLKAWLKKRYPGVTPAGTTIAEVEQDVTAKIRAGSGGPHWYATNYGIKILKRTEAEARLKSIGHRRPKELEGLKDFSEPDLRVLELVLASMSDEIVKTFKGLQLIRQRVFNKWIGPGPDDFEEQPKVGGVTIMPGTTRTTIIFDHASVNADALFIGGIGPGGRPAVAVATAQVFGHELGHTIEKRPGVQRAFNKLAAEKHIKPITWYAASDPTNELFAESFALYYSDPKWLAQNWPDLFDFFNSLDKEGKPKF